MQTKLINDFCQCSGNLALMISLSVTLFFVKVVSNIRYTQYRYHKLKEYNLIREKYNIITLDFL